MAGNVSNTITLRAQGVDATTRMLRGLSARLGAFSGMVSALSQRALSSFAATVQEMTSLSDRAADARTTSAELRKLAAAMGEIGVKGASIDTVSHAMQEMVRRTGEEGTRGFMRILAGIAQVESAQERATLLAEAFGKQAGAAFAVLVDNGVAGLEQGLGRVADGFWTATEDAVNSGDAIADKWAQVTFGFQTGFQNAIGQAFGFLSQWVDISATNVSKWCATIVKWVVDAFRAVFHAGRWLGTALRGIFMGVLHSVQGLFDAAAKALEGDFSGAAASLRGIPAQFREDWGDMTAELKNIFPDDLFSVPGDGAATSIAETIKAAAAETPQWLADRIARGPVAEAAKTVGKSVGEAITQGARSFAGFLSFGSNDARKLAFSAQADPVEREMLKTQRDQLKAVQEIAGTLATLEATA